MLETISIPWLHVLREHPSFLKNYEGLFAPSNALSRRGQAVIARLRSATGWLRQIWTALRSDAEPWKASHTLSEPVDILFVSHQINGAGTNISGDFYFGSLPEVVQANGYKVLVALIDHSTMQDVTRTFSWIEGDVPRVLLSKTFSLSSELSLFLRLRKESLKLASLAKKVKSGLLRKVFERASIAATSGGARTTLRMSVQIGQLVSKYKPKMLIVTYEGHAWERAAFAAAREVNASILCAGYQHAAIFRLQHSALRKLGLSYDPDIVFTAGLVSQKQIQNSSKLQGVPLHILGSHKAFAGVKSDVSNRSTENCGNKCLVLPEGIISECLILFEFTLKCAKLIPSMQFIWRLHPLVTFESLVVQSPLLQKKLPNNVHLSTSTIDDDVNGIDYALYRGSSAIVTAVCAGAYPIYLAVPDEISTDPLYELRAWRESVTDPNKFVSLVNRGKQVDGVSEEQISATNYCSDFYASTNASVLLETLRNL